MAFLALKCLTCVGHKIKTFQIFRTHPLLIVGDLFYILEAPGIPFCQVELTLAKMPHFLMYQRKYFAVE